MEIKIQTINPEETIKDAINCSAIFKINEETEEIIFQGLNYKVEKVRILREENGERVFVYKGNERWITLSSELYDNAKKILSDWNNNWMNKMDEFMIADKDAPLILVNKPMGIIIAPRVEMED